MIELGKGRAVYFDVCTTDPHIYNRYESFYMNIVKEQTKEMTFQKACLEHCTR